ncbi:toll/interleukin-1 receptor domain-containing protein [Solemya velum gill symbiont]|uniref:toll/interleukin-1 receptor domain-containing protein n=1 Tax=Solemya velum gill symbiont TaxID=2340 RepID=UPI000996F5E5|nr:toll/interleukin-1 receptor domain-containing protein [Solemya velum gill symbiont]OOZ42905.1 hypothetical protein BOW37_12610 [Solemya velum gill symbiont]OOZ43766.1 hypothetical protein BOW38_12210 [Solemya velum gill symbiont]OOZ47551.1 hypothetical protein BOW39_12990 [Solemya velum gill symbiont]OOZ48787.1 hypothetical protein BOW40_12400 [Solemya velum gill symbiont]OOZ52679.1 hypothetical protein BOW41_12360 [Solemya velum gill symbiont]
MAEFITFDEIRYLNERSYSRLLIEKAEKQYKSGSTFLSYSTLDDEYLPTIIGILENHGASVYIDKKDPKLPQITDQSTAAILRENIALTSKFVLFVTPNSKESNWIPWELGLADGEKTNSKVALFPAAERKFDQHWAKQEYLGLYDQIVWGHFEDKQNEWLVLNHEKNTAVPLGHWIRG